MVNPEGKPDTKLIILDRDGVINFDSDSYIKSVDEWQPIPGSLEAIAALNRAGWTVAIATNQSGLGRGYYNETTLSAMHDKMYRLLHAVGGCIDHICYCPHLPDAGCACRKPKPGMLLAVANSYQLEMADVYFVGDSMKDIQAAQSAGARPILVLTGKGSDTLKKLVYGHSVPVYADLAEFAHYIIHST